MKFHDQYEIIDLGEHEEWVYDIEVEDNHNFFGNDILLHNSLYLSLDKIVKDFYKGNVPDDPKIVSQFIDKFFKKKIQILIDDAIEILMKEFNASDIQNEHKYFQMGREVIGDVGFFETKKKYCIRVWDDEGVKLDHYKLKIMGMRLKKRDTPKIIRKWLIEALEILLDGDNGKLLKYNKERKKDFMQLQLNEIAINKPINKMSEYYYNGDENKFEGRTPGHVRAALRYNYILKKMDIEDRYDTIVEGTNVKMIYLNEPNPISNKNIAWPYNADLPKEFNLKEFINWDLQFEKVYVNILKPMMEIMKWDYKGRQSLDDLFADFI